MCFLQGGGGGKGGGGEEEGKKLVSRDTETN